tara:strand:+ start:810 stop:1424 length:615 start_codon:yes stop_codon:yes gene_type:complete
MADTTLSNAFITLNDVINNFLISYTGPGKLIPDAVRTEVIFHARRCLQEFAYETLKSKFVATYPTPMNSIKFLMSDFVAVISISLNDPGVYVGALYPKDSPTSLPINGYFINLSNKTVGAVSPNSIKFGTSSGDITFTYLSNALTTDESAAIPKLAEEALYSCIIYAILANREKTRPDVLQRLLIEKTDKLERAKSRLVFTNFD